MATLESLARWRFTQTAEYLLSSDGKETPDLAGGNGKKKCVRCPLNAESITNLPDLFQHQQNSRRVSCFSRLARIPVS
ncbi:MAG: hypothetical protein U0X75_22815 [Acidobacteriota bacterium]